MVTSPLSSVDSISRHSGGVIETRCISLANVNMYKSIAIAVTHSFAVELRYNNCPSDSLSRIVVYLRSTMAPHEADSTNETVMIKHSTNRKFAIKRGIAAGTNVNDRTNDVRVSGDS